MKPNAATTMRRTDTRPQVRALSARLTGHAVIGLGIFAVFLFAISPGEVNRYDEGLILNGAAWVLDGAVPYRDFWTIYAPGQFWALAGWFKLFGTSVLSERIYDALARTLLTIACYSAAWAFTRRRGPTAMTATLSVAWLWYIGFYGYPLIPASAAAIGACVALVQWLEAERSTGLLVVAGLLAAVAAVFRHDVGAYTALALLIGVALAGNRQRRAIPILLSTMLLGGLPALLFLLVNVPIRELWAQLVAFPLTTYADVRALPFPSISKSLHAAMTQPGDLHRLSNAVVTVMLGLPLPVAVFGLYLGLRNGYRHRVGKDAANDLNGHATALILLSVLTLLLFSKGLVRPSAVQMLPAILLASTLLCCWLTSPHARARRLAPSILLLFLPPVIASGQALFQDGLGPHTMVGVIERSNHEAVGEIPRARGFKLPEDQRRAVSFLREQTAPDTAIYVGKPRHDRIFVNDVLFYFLAERPSTTRFAELHPGEVTTRATQAEMIAALERNAVTWVVIWRGAMHQEPNASGRSSGVRLLDRYIGNHYAQIQAFGDYLILKRSKD